MKTLKRLVADESGATAIEYGLLAALISVVVIAGAQLLGANLGSMFNDLGDCVGNPVDNNGAVRNVCQF